MREFAPFAMLAVACAATFHEPTGCRRLASAPNSPAGNDSAASAASAASSPSPDRFEALASRGAALAPGMHEAVRKESTGDKVEVVRAAGRDVCLRVAFESTAPVVAKLVDGAGNLLAETDAGTVGGMLGAEGPVCIRKGDAVSASAEGSGARVWWVAWVSP